MSDGPGKKSYITGALILGFGLLCFIYFSSAGQQRAKEEEYQKVIHAYEEAVYHKKVEVYKNEYKIKAVEVAEEKRERVRLEAELKKANDQIAIANKELQKANQIIENEAAAIAEWKVKTDAQEGTIKELNQRLSMSKNETDVLTRETQMLHDYAMRKDAAISMVMNSIDKTDKDITAGSAEAYQAKVSSIKQQLNDGKTPGEKRTSVEERIAEMRASSGGGRKLLRAGGEA